MRFLSLTRRLPIINRKWGVELKLHLLRDIYKRHGISHRQAKVHTRLSEAREATLADQRELFAR